MPNGALSGHSVSKCRCDGKANAQEDTVGHATVAAKCLDGKACAAEVESELLQRVETLNESNIQPHLAVIIVGDDPASHVYVNAKVRMCERLGIRSTHIALPADTDESVLRQHIETMNQQQDLDGILVQSPLPNHMDEEALTDMIHPLKGRRWIPSAKPRSSRAGSSGRHAPLHAEWRDANARMGGH